MHPDDYHKLVVRFNNAQSEIRELRHILDEGIGREDKLRHHLAHLQRELAKQSRRRWWHW